MDNETTLQQRQNEAREVILSGHVWRAVWFLAWPTAINTLIMSAYNIINRVFLGRLPDADNALAAIGIGGAILMIQFAVTIGLSAGTSALVSRFLGARNIDDAREVAGQSLVLSAVVGALSGIPLFIWSAQLAHLIGAQPDVVPLASGYIGILSWFSAPLFVYMITTTALQSSGDVRSPLYIGAVVVAINILVDWLLIFGIGPFPRMGVTGAAYGTGISRVVGMLLALGYLKQSILSGAFHHLKPHPDWYRRILNIGWPASFQNLLWTAAYAGFIKILGMLPGDLATASQAAMTVAITIESVAFMPGVAFSIAATPLVGQNLGAGNPKRAEHSAWVATAQAAAIMGLVAILFVTIPRQLALLFTQEPSIVQLIVGYLIINAAAEPFLAVNMVLRGGLQGAGETRMPAVITVVTHWLLRLPLAYLLAVHLGYGPEGAWIAMAVSTFLSGVLVAAWFKWGSWRNVEV